MKKTCKIKFYNNLPYIKRVFSLFKPSIIMIFIICLVYGFIKGGNTFLFCIIFITMNFLILFSYSLIINIFFLNTVDIIEENDTINLSILKFNKIYKEIETNINTTDIRIIEKTGVYRTYQLEIIIHNRIFFKQRTVGGWTEKQFIEIVTTLNKLKGKQTVLNYVK